MRHLASVLDSADDLLVDALAQPVWCAEPARMTIQKTLETAAEYGYDTLPVRDAGDGRIRQIIERDALETSGSWDEVLAGADPLTAELLVPRESSVLRFLDRIDEHRRLFTLGRNGDVDGIVTIYDLNQPAAHLLAFGMALVCEADLADELRRVLGESPVRALAEACAALGGKASGIKRWKRDREADAHLHVATTLSFGEKLRVLRYIGFEELARRHGLSSEDLDADLTAVLELRNAIGHYDEGRLADPDWTFRRMRIAQGYARRIRDASATRVATLGRGARPGAHDRQA